MAILLSTAKDGTGWLNGIREFEAGRVPFRPACAQVVRGVLEANATKQSRILEVGSGIGELLRLAPEYKGKIQQTDIGRRVVEQNRKVTGDPNVVMADVRRLPFRSGSYDLVIGFSAFDTMRDLGPALGEIRRVLAPGGKFVHFLDLQADLEPLVKNYHSGGIVAFPSKGKAPGQLRFKLIPQSRLFPGEADPKAAFSGSAMLWSLISTKTHDEKILSDWTVQYARNPAVAFGYLQMSEELNCFAKFVDANIISENVVGTNDYFHERLLSALLRSGFVAEAGKRTGTAILEKAEFPMINHRANVIATDMGIDTACFSSEVAERYGHDKIESTATLHVAIASPV